MPDLPYKDKDNDYPLAYSRHKIICNDRKEPVDYQIIEINANFERVTGLLAANVKGKTIKELFPNISEEPFDWIGTFGRVALTGDRIEIKEYFRATQKWFRISAYSPQINEFALLFTDISEQKEKERLLLENKDLLQTIFSQIPIGLAICRRDRTVVKSNSSFEQITGYSGAELDERPWTEAVHPDDRERDNAQYGKFLDGKIDGYAFTQRYTHPSDGISRLHVKITPLQEKSRQYHLCIIQGIAQPLAISRAPNESDRAPQKNRPMEKQDMLTGLYDLQYYNEEKQRLNTKGTLPIAILIGDLNGLRLMNYAYGYRNGDALIQKTTDILKAHCRKTDILARVNGDEFRILMPNTGHETAKRILAQIEKACADHNDAVSKNERKISLTFGIAIKTMPEENLDLVEKTAEEEMRARKMLNSNSSHSAIVSAIMATMFAHSQETENHCRRIASFSRRIGGKLNLPENQLDQLELFAMLHDIGKVGIKDAILHNPDALTEAEWVIMKKHPEIGSRIALSSPQFAPIAPLILSHHERWDGKGYPQGLKGEEIPLLARILAVVDAYDAMTTGRIYCKAKSKNEACRELQKNAGIQFDPAIVGIFLDSIDKDSIDESLKNHG